jgi:hypothetical protein
MISLSTVWWGSRALWCRMNEDIDRHPRRLIRDIKFEEVFRALNAANCAVGDADLRRMIHAMDMKQQPLAGRNRFGRHGGAIEPETVLKPLPVEDVLADMEVG